MELKSIYIFASRNLNNHKMELSKKAKEALTEEVKLRLALKLGKHINTIRNWIKLDSEMLTTISTIEALSELTGVDKNELFERSETTA